MVTKNTNVVRMSKEDFIEAMRLLKAARIDENHGFVVWGDTPDDRGANEKSAFGLHQKYIGKTTPIYPYDVRVFNWLLDEIMSDVKVSALEAGDPLITFH